MDHPKSVDLSVTVGAVRLANPVIAASGTFAYGIEFAGQTDLNRLGGIVVKGLSLEPMEGAPPPRLVPTPCGILNAVGLQNIGVRAFIAEKLPALRGYRMQIVANVFGSSQEEYVEVVRHLEDAEGLAAYELNISCPNTACGGLQFGSDPRTAAALVALVRKVARRPLWVKLSPDIGSIGVMARAVEGAGADALTVANTYPAMSVDVRTQKSRLGNLTGGLSGRAIKPLTLRLVYEAQKAVKLPIIGLGGIVEAADVAEYLLVGATAIQVGTANFTGPKTCEDIVDALEDLCMSVSCNRISDLIGALKTKND